MAGSLAQADVALDDRAENHFLEMLAQFGDHLRVHLGAAVEHGNQEAFDRKVGVRSSLDQTNGLEKFPKALKCKEFRLHGNDHRVGCSKAVHGDEAQRRGAVYDDVVVIVAYGFQDPLKHRFTLRHFQHFDFGSDEIDVRRNQVQARHFGLD